MADCRNCFHYEDCHHYYFGVDNLDTARKVEEHCNMFIDRDLIIRLPCKIGTKIYRLKTHMIINCADIGKRLIQWAIISDYLSPDNLSNVIEELGETYFLTFEEAEKAAMEKIAKQKAYIEKFLEKECSDD